MAAPSSSRSDSSSRRRDTPDPEHRTASSSVDLVVAGIIEKARQLVATGGQEILVFVLPLFYDDHPLSQSLRQLAEESRGIEQHIDPVAVAGELGSAGDRAGRGRGSRRRRRVAAPPRCPRPGRSGSDPRRAR